MPITISSQHGLRFDFLISGVPAGRTLAIWVESSGPADVTGRGNGTWTFTFSRPYAAAGLWAYYEDTWAEFASIYPFSTRPAVDTVTPSQGPLTGGTVVRLQDTSANPGIYDRTDAGTRSWVTRVRFGSGSNPPQGTQLNIINAKTLDVTTPAGSAGAQPITLDYNIGSSAITGIATGRTFNYQAAPIVATVSGVARTATVTITGGLTGAAQARIYFDYVGAPSSYLTVTTSAPSATWTYPQPGQYTIRVLRVSDNSETTLFYTTLPVAWYVYPGGGSPRGGEVVSIWGELMSIVTGVLFGSRQATGLNVVSDNELEVVTPPNTGSLPLRFQTPYGEVQSGLMFLFRSLDVTLVGRGLDVSVTVSGIDDTMADVLVYYQTVMQGGVETATPQQPTVDLTLPFPGEFVISVIRYFDMYQHDIPYATMPFIDTVTPERGDLGSVVQLEGGLFDLVEEVWFGGRKMEFTRISDSVIEVVADG